MEQEAAYFYDFVYQEEQIEQPFDDWLPGFMSHLSKVLTGEEQPSDTLVQAMRIAHSRASTKPTPEHPASNLLCLCEEPEVASSEDMTHSDQNP